MKNNVEKIQFIFRILLKEDAFNKASIKKQALSTVPIFDFIHKE